MYCEKCGYPNPDGAGFCRSCGAALKFEERDENGKESGQDFDDVLTQEAEFAEGPVSYENAAPNPALEVLREIISSPLFLAGVIAVSAGIIINIISSFTGSSVFSALTDITQDGAQAAASPVSAGILAVVLSIPAIIMAIGLWHAWASAGSKNPFSMKTGGLTAVKVILLICCIALWAVCVIVLLAAVIYAAAISRMSFYMMDELAGTGIIFVVFAVVLDVCIVFVSVFFLKCVQGINGVKRTISSGFPSGKLSMYVPVFGFILAAADLISGFVMLFSEGGVLVFIYAVICAAEYVIFSIIALKYRAELKALNA